MKKGERSNEKGGKDRQYNGQMKKGGKGQMKKGERSNEKGGKDRQYNGQMKKGERTDNTMVK